LPDQHGHSVDGVDAVLLRGVSVGEYGDQVVTAGTADPAGGVDLPSVDASLGGAHAVEIKFKELISAAAVEGDPDEIA